MVGPCSSLIVIAICAAQAQDPSLPTLAHPAALNPPAPAPPWAIRVPLADAAPGPLGPGTRQVTNGPARGPPRAFHTPPGPLASESTSSFQVPTTERRPPCHGHGDLHDSDDSDPCLGHWRRRLRCVT
jgi:hypothetical protein